MTQFTDKRDSRFMRSIRPISYGSPLTVWSDASRRRNPARPRDIPGIACNMGEARVIPAWRLANDDEWQRMPDISDRLTYTSNSRVNLTPDWRAIP
ncbi:hypothetical protein HUS70_22030 [Pandoraea nosoerga]|uniref:hypothetical protein n=1 Tax=Pandoraea TaxID=93217 RepID=UPI0012419402|nr:MULTISPECIES: hypothetical protein [Pandoraea]MBN4666302.1 hypothetical protein [Pandoraea nosoerga]MBN4678113.1 hypothetical protein [Pandoraea nosoerga]MBN4683349.1 hypothetical protein [Pandoraea nosoerga]MBN4747268.1 hypothetical protein [Pandoraea nosoerga]